MFVYSIMFYLSFIFFKKYINLKIKKAKVLFNMFKSWVCNFFFYWKSLKFLPNYS